MLLQTFLYFHLYSGLWVKWVKSWPEGRYLNAGQWPFLKRIEENANTTRSIVFQLAYKILYFQLLLFYLVILSKKNFKVLLKFWSNTLKKHRKIFNTHKTYRTRRKEKLEQVFHRLPQLLHRSNHPRFNHHSFNKHFRTYCVPRTILSHGETMMNKTNLVPDCGNLTGRIFLFHHLQAQWKTVLHNQS